jgi:tellurite resistance protein
MGLFDKVLGGGNDKLNEAEGMAGIALCAIAADGVVTEEEAAGLGTTLSRMKLYHGMSPRDINKMFEKVLKVARGQGVEVLMNQSAEAIKPALRPTAFAIATDLLFADGDVAPEERRYLEKIQKNLGVSDEQALKIVEVMQIKNLG